MIIKEREEIIDYAIEKVTRLLIEADFEDKTRGKARYVKKVQAYKDIVKLLKEIRRW